MESTVLPDWEMILYWILSFTSHLYSFYQLHLFSKDHEESLGREGELEQSFIIWTSKRDVMDFEWSFWSEWAWHSLLWSLIGHALVSQLSRVCVPQLRKAVLTVYGVLCAWWLLGLRGVAVLMLQLTVSLAVAQVRSPALSWGCSLLQLSTLYSSSVQDVQRHWYDSDDEHHLLMFSTAMCVLRCISFSLELCWSPLLDKPTNHNLRTFLLHLYDLITYCFYHPLFYNGPVLNYPHFKLQMDSAVCKVPLVLMLCETLRVCMWWCLAELMIHSMYIHSIQNSESFLNMLPPWALGGLALALVQFFYVKYLVLFGVASLLMKLDGIHPPPLPRCVSTMYSFQGMWRHFDVGLYRWLLRYVYVPLGGSRRGLLLKVVSMAMAFGFVCVWHGCHDYLRCWALLNWLCVFTENCITHLLSWAPLQQTISCYVSQPMRRRGLALGFAFSTALLILSNLVFMGGVHIGRVYWERVFVQGWSSMLIPVLGCLYCFAHVGLEMDRKQE